MPGGGPPPAPHRVAGGHPDPIKRQFPAARLNQKLYGDGTEIPIGEDKPYLASVMYAASRRVEITRPRTAPPRAALFGYWCR